LVEEEEGGEEEEQQQQAPQPAQERLQEQQQSQKQSQKQEQQAQEQQVSQQQALADGPPGERQAEGHPAEQQPTEVVPLAARPPDGPAPEVWFEVSPFTSRLHFHLAPDGSRPLGLSLPLDVLAMGGGEEDPLVAEILRQWPEQGEQPPGELQRSNDEEAAGQQGAEEGRPSGGGGEAADEARSGGGQQPAAVGTPQARPAPAAQEAAASGADEPPRSEGRLAAALAIAFGSGGQARGRGSARSALCGLLSPPARGVARASPTAGGPGVSTACEAGGRPGSEGGGQGRPRSISSTPGFVAATPLTEAEASPAVEGSSDAGAVSAAPPGADGTPGVVAATPVAGPVGADAGGVGSQPLAVEQREAVTAALTNQPLHSEQQPQQQQPQERQPQQQQQLQEQPQPQPQEQEQQQLPPPPRGPACRSARGFLGPLGVVAPALPLPRTHLLDLLSEARAFARDWGELRPVTRNRLHCRVVSSCLGDAVEAAAVAAAGGGALGVGTERYLPAMDARPLPPGVALRDVWVRYPGVRRPLARHRQPFADSTGERLCLHCIRPVPDCCAPADAVLEGGVDLFCGLECERAHYIKSSSGELAPPPRRGAGPPGLGPPRRARQRGVRACARGRVGDGPATRRQLASVVCTR
jgi:hypothetical protein